MPSFEPFLREPAEPQTFSAELGQRVVEAKAVLHSIGPLYPDFDTYMLAPLGRAVSGELARAVAGSRRQFNGSMSADANSYVPMWTELGADYYYLGRFTHAIDFGEANPFREAMEGSINVTQQQAVRIARECLKNASATVENANFALRSLFNFLVQEPEHDQAENGIIVANSNALVARLARLNDTVEGKPGIPEFQRFVGVPARFLADIDGRANDVIATEHLVCDQEELSVDLTPEAKEKAQECSPNAGCPSLRLQVEWRGQTVPMLEAFWDGAVEVAIDRIEQAKAVPFMY